MTRTLYREVSGPVDIDRDGTIFGRIVEWDVDAEVVEPIDVGFDHYVERWARGAFDAQARSTNRGTLAKVELRETHVEGLGKVGYALAFEGRDDGEYATLRVLPRHRDDIAQMVADGIDGLSVGFHPKRGGTIVRQREAAGGLDLRIRTDAHLEHVALVAEPAYGGARVLEMRDAADAERFAAAQRLDALEQIDELLAQRDRWSHLTT